MREPNGYSDAFHHAIFDNPILSALWNRVADAHADMCNAYDARNPRTPINYDGDARLGADAMFDYMAVCHESDLLMWVDDCEDRVGMHAADFRATMLDYIAVRDDTRDDPDGNCQTTAMRALSDLARDDRDFAAILSAYATTPAEACMRIEHELAGIMRPASNSD